MEEIQEEAGESVSQMGEVDEEAAAEVSDEAPDNKVLPVQESTRSLNRKSSLKPEIAQEREKSAELLKQTSILKQQSHVRLQEPSIQELRKSSKDKSRTSKEFTSSASLSNLRASLMGASQSRSFTNLSKKTNRESKTKAVLGSIISIRRTSTQGDFFDRQKAAKFMNTYKLDADNPFNVEKVEKILKDVLVEALENLTYDPDKCSKQAKWASSAIRAKVKEQEFDRFKLICIVTIGEKNSQDVYHMVRFLWDAERDKYAFFVHENMHVFAVATCFGIYYE